MEDLLLSMISEVNKRRQLLEWECNMLKDLLKPWPHREKKQGSGNTGVEEANKKNECKREAEDLSAEEKETLHTVEKLLHKAQITRHTKSLKQSQDQAENVAMKNHTDSRHSNNSSLLPENERTVQNSETTDPTSDMRSKRIESLNETCKKGISDKEFQAPAANSRSKKSHKFSKEQCKVTKNLAQLPQPLRHPRPGSSKSRHTPVHMTAPFKTEENLKLPHRKNLQPHGHAPRKPTPNSRPWSAATCVLPDINQCNKSNTAQRKKPHTTHQSVVNTSNPQSSIDHSEPPISFNDNECSSYETQRTDGDKGNEDEAGSATVRMCSGSTSQVSSIVADLAQADEQEFLIQKNGRDLKVPNQLSKIVKLNSSMYDQCCATELVKKVSPADTGQQFIESLKATWTVSEELWTRVRAITCLKSHEMLMDMISHLNLSSLTVQSSYQELYRAKRILEFVLSFFASLQEESDYLSGVQFRDIKLDPSFHAPDAGPHTPKYDPQDFFHLINEKSSSHQPDVSELLRGNETWANLRFQKEYLYLQLWLLELINAEWWFSSVTDIELRFYHIDPQRFDNTASTVQFDDNCRGISAQFC